MLAQIHACVRKAQPGNVHEGFARSATDHGTSTTRKRALPLIMRS